MQVGKKTKGKFENFHKVDCELMQFEYRERKNIMRKLLDLLKLDNGVVKWQKVQKMRLIEVLGDVKKISIDDYQNGKI